MNVVIPDWFFKNLDFIGYGFLSYGVWQFSKLKIDGFLYAAVGCIIILAWGIYWHHWGTIVWNILFALLYYNAYKKNEKMMKLLEKIR